MLGEESGDERRKLEDNTSNSWKCSSQCEQSVGNRERVTVRSAKDPCSEKSQTEKPLANVREANSVKEEG